MEKNICLSRSYFIVLVSILVLFTFCNNMNKNKKTDNSDLINQFNLLKKDNKITIKSIKNILEENNSFKNKLENELKNKLENELKNKIENELKNKLENELKNKINKNITIRDNNVVNDPLYPPKKRLPRHLYNTVNSKNFNQLTNIRTRGNPDNYQMVGLLTRKNDEKILHLYGRQKYPGSRQWEYYVTGNDPNGLTAKIPFKINNDEMIDDNTIYSVPHLSGEFVPTIYDNNAPVYNPYVY